MDAIEEWRINDLFLLVGAESEVWAVTGLMCRGQKSDWTVINSFWKQGIKFQEKSQEALGSPTKVKNNGVASRGTTLACVTKEANYQSNSNLRFPVLCPVSYRSTGYLSSWPLFTLCEIGSQACFAQSPGENRLQDGLKENESIRRVRMD